MSSKKFALDFRPITDFSHSKLKDFDCGNHTMNQYLGRYARKNHKAHLSPCLIAVPRGENGPALGYVTLSNATIAKGDPPYPPLESFPNYPIPVTLIGRLAVSEDCKRQGIGRRILMHVFFNHAKTVREHHIGSVGIITDAIDQIAVTFYESHDFQTIPEQDSFPKRMFISNATIFDAID